MTDRLRLAPGVTAFARQREALTDLVAIAADAGVDLVQVRERDLGARELCNLVEDAVRVTRGSGTRVVVNDRADVALAAGADGVHLPADGPPVDRVRALGPAQWVIGRSAHSPAELSLAASADYVVFGTVFPTASKPGAAAQGVEALAAAVRQVSCPVLAIGGVNGERAGDCARAGAMGVAAISLFLPAGASPDAVGPREAVRILRHQFGLV